MDSKRISWGESGTPAGATKLVQAYAEIEKVRQEVRTGDEALRQLVEKWTGAYGLHSKLTRQHTRGHNGRRLWSAPAGLPS